MHKYPDVPKKCSLQHLTKNISKQNFKLSQNRHILYSTVCHLILCVKKWGSPSSFWRKRRLISLNSSAFTEKLSSSKGARACAHANHVKNHAQKGCTMQLNGITFNKRVIWKYWKLSYYYEVHCTFRRYVSVPKCQLSPETPEAPDDIKKLLVEYKPSRSLRLSTQNLLAVPPTKSKTGDRAFQVATPKLWNSTPSSIRLASSLTSFKSLVNTFLFKKCFP